MCYHLAMLASDNFILMNLCNIFIILCISFCLFVTFMCVTHDLTGLPPPLIYNAITFYFFICVCYLFPNIAHLSTNNKQAKNQSTKWFIYSFIITICKSNSYFTFYTQTLPLISYNKKNYLWDRQILQVSNTITNSNSIHNHPQPKKKKNHRFTNIIRVWTMECR